MPAPLRALIVEDSADDAALLLHELRRADFAVTHERVETAEELRAALARGAWDLVLSDYNLPQFNAVDALAVVRASGLDLPFIVVSGTVGEETAVAAMRTGVSDYLLKGHLARLRPAIDRELREAANRQALREREERFRLLAEVSSDAVWDWDVQADALWWNEGLRTLFHYPPRGRPPQFGVVGRERPPRRPGAGRRGPQPGT